MLLQSAGVTGDFIAGQVRRMPQKVVLVMDCCQSGDILLALQGARAGGVDNDEMLQLLANGTGIFLLTAAAGSELAREIDPKHKIPHGVFTYALLQGIEKKTADEKGDGVITVKELSRYLDRDFGVYVKKYIGAESRQNPIVNSLGRDSYTAEILDFPLVSVK